MTPTEIIEALRLARLARRMSQIELAQRLETTPQSIGKWELGKSRPNFETLYRWCEILDLELKISNKNEP